MFENDKTLWGWRLQTTLALTVKSCSCRIILSFVLQSHLLLVGRREAAGPQSGLRWDRGDTRGLRRERTLYLWREVWYLTEVKLGCRFFCFLVDIRVMKSCQLTVCVWIHFQDKQDRPLKFNYRLNGVKWELKCFSYSSSFIWFQCVFHIRACQDVSFGFMWMCWLFFWPVSKFWNDILLRSVKIFQLSLLNIQHLNKSCLLSPSQF